MRNIRHLVILICASGMAQAAAPFRFAVIGDRTGSTQPGVYEKVWTALAAEHPEFVLCTGDLVEGGRDASAESEWKEWSELMAPWKAIPFYSAPGNHDIWSASSESQFRKYTGHPAHFGVDAGPVHVTVLDNSRADGLTPEEYAFAEDDLKEHAAAAVKIIISHRPFWLLSTVLDGGDFAIQRLAKKYGVQYVVAGHVHAMLHATVDGVEYISMPSSGGHLRASSKYEDGWFFGYGWVEVQDGKATFRIRALDGAETVPAQWGMTGLKPPDPGR